MPEANGKSHDPPAPPSIPAKLRAAVDAVAAKLRAEGLAIQRVLIVPDYLDDHVPFQIGQILIDEPIVGHPMAASRNEPLIEAVRREINGRANRRAESLSPHDDDGDDAPAPTPIDLSHLKAVHAAFTKARKATAGGQFPKLAEAYNPPVALLRDLLDASGHDDEESLGGDPVWSRIAMAERMVDSGFACLAHQSPSLARHAFASAEQQLQSAWGLLKRRADRPRSQPSPDSAPAPAPALADAASPRSNFSVKPTTRIVLWAPATCHYVSVYSHSEFHVTPHPDLAMSFADAGKLTKWIADQPRWIRGRMIDFRPSAIVSLGRDYFAPKVEAMLFAAMAEGTRKGDEREAPVAIKAASNANANARATAKAPTAGGGS